MDLALGSHDRVMRNSLSADAMIRSGCQVRLGSVQRQHRLNGRSVPGRQLRTTQIAQRIQEGSLTIEQEDGRHVETVGSSWYWKTNKRVDYNAIIMDQSLPKNRFVLFFSFRVALTQDGVPSRLRLSCDVPVRGCLRGIKISALNISLSYFAAVGNKETEDSHSAFLVVSTTYANKHA